MKQPRARRTIDDASSRGPLTVQKRSGVLAVAGELDAATAPAVTAALEPLIGAGAHVQINVRDVTFIGSAGLHVLEDAALSLPGGSRVILLDPSRVVLRAIELIGLRGDIDIVTPIPRYDVALAQRTSDCGRNSNASVAQRPRSSNPLPEA
jgi:anti-anti-sigma factor